MAEELRPVSSFGLRGANENIWHVAAAERWSDGRPIGHRTYCGRNYGVDAHTHVLADLDDICSDCTSQVTERH